jgi:Stress responsive A/B Barrel Domain
VLRHVLMFRLKDEATEDNRRALQQQFHVMQERIDELRRVACGPDAGLAGPEFDNPDFIAIMDFDDEPSWRRYLVHPAHDEFADHYLLPILVKTTGVQFFLDGNAEEDGAP